MSPISAAPPPATNRVVFLAAVDDTSAADRVVAVGAALAAKIAGAELHLVHVLDDLPASDPLVRGPLVPTLTDRLEGGRALLDRLGAEARPLFSGRVVGHLAAGAAWREILQMSTNLQADLVLVGTHARRGIERVLLGSIAQDVVKKASCPVLVVRPKDYHVHQEPQIEPPCSDCLAIQRATNGETLWCEAHAHRRPRSHLHYELPESFALGSSILRA